MTQKPIQTRSPFSLAVVASVLSAGSLAVNGCGNAEPGGQNGESPGGTNGTSGGQVGQTSAGSSGQAPIGGTAASGATNGGGTAGGASPGAAGGGGALTGGSAGSGGASSGGRGGAGGNGQSGGSATAGAAGSTGGGTCTASKPVAVNATGSGPHKVTVETNADPGIQEGTIYRPTDLGGTEKYPIFVWGNGACSQDGLSNTAAMAEIASHGYFVVADGKPKGSGGRSQTSNWVAMGKPLLAYVTWAIAENGKGCSAYHDSLDTTKVASNGFSCGGLMSEGTAGDPRMSSVGVTSSGLTSADTAFYKTVHTPVLIILGGTSDIAYQNGERDYDNISALGLPIMLFSKNIGHGGDLGSARGGDFTKINLAWLNWRLKADEGATGKGVLVGAGCTYCSNSAWEVKSKNIP